MQNGSNSFKIASKLFLLSILLLPVLSLYRTIVSSFSIGDALLLISILYLLFASRCKISINIPLFLLIVFVFFQGILFFGPNNINNSLLRTFRYSFYLFALALSDTASCEFDWIVKKYKQISLGAALLIFIQTMAFKLFGVIIPGVLAFLPLSDPSLYDYKQVFMYQNSQRCMSLFAEPSHFAIYVLPCILICLLERKTVSLNNWICAFFLSFGILLSSTFTGLLGLIVVYGLWAAKSFINRKVSWKAFLAISIAVLGFFLLVFKSSFGQYLLNANVRMKQSQGRFSGYSYMWDSFPSFTILDLFFGHGMNDIAKQAYLPGWPRLFYYYGGCGSILYLTAFYQQANKHAQSKALLILLAIISIGSEIAFGQFLGIYLLLTKIDPSQYEDKGLHENE